MAFPRRQPKNHSIFTPRIILLVLAIIMLPSSLFFSMSYVRTKDPVSRPVVKVPVVGIADKKLVKKMDTLLNAAAPHPLPTFRTMIGTPEPRATPSPDITHSPGARLLYAEVYSHTGCGKKGEVKVIDLDIKERRCSKPCVDFCTEKFDNHDVLQGAAKSIKIFGAGKVKMYSSCRGHWSYPDEGYAGDYTKDSGCVELTGKLTNVVHLELLHEQMPPPPPPTPQPKDNAGDATADSAVGVFGETWKPVAFDYNKIDGSPTDYNVVLKRLKYWENRQREGTVELLPLAPTDKYVTFYVDCGGFNNIRIGFEHAVIMAWMHKRTLVLPPAQPWYLLDFGPMKRDPPKGESGKSNYDMFMDIEDMKKSIAIITTDEFLKREKDSLNVPAEYLSGIDGKNEALNKWMDSHDQFMKISFNPIENAVCHPSVAEYQASADLGSQAGGKSGLLARASMIDARKLKEFTADHAAKKILHFPSCKGGPDFRYMGQTGAVVLWSDLEHWQKFAYQMMRFVHYIPKVAEIAAKVVARLGLFQYSSLHIRRNDLQYPENFIPAEKSLENVGKLLKQGETLYIATDEPQPDFFAPFEKAGHKVYRWQDFFTEKGGNVLNGIDIPRKNIGHIEQMICSGGRWFAGTRASTFSSFIFRLRGYVGAPERAMYWHIRSYNGDKDHDWREMPGGQGFVRGREYMNEMPYMWQLLTGEDGNQK